MTKNITIGVLALQGGVIEHLNLLRKAADHILTSQPSDAATPEFTFDFAEVRTAPQLALCDALIIPGGESTTMAIVARRLGLLDPLRDFVKSVPPLFTIFTRIKDTNMSETEPESNTNPFGAPAPGWSCWPSRRRRQNRVARS